MAESRKRRGRVSMKTSTPGRRSRRVVAVLFAAILAAVAALALGAVPALADSTHKYVESWPTPAGTEPIPMAVDDEGNVYVWNELPNTVSRYDGKGNPVPFASLGTNTIDGEGFGEDCPATPDDCDKVPSNGFGDTGQALTSYRGFVSVDNSGGPADGYIYVSNPAGGPPEAFTGEPTGAIEVFDSSGRFRGEIDRSLDGPLKSGPGGGLATVDKFGHVFVHTGRQIDEFVPLDGVPAHDNFRGQIYVEFQREGFGDNPYSYTSYGIGGDFHKWPYDEYTIHRKGFTALEVPFPADVPIFEGAADPELNVGLETISLDPQTHDVYLASGGIGNIRIKQFDMNNNPIGPFFGLGHTGQVWKLAVDGTASAARGTVYTQGRGTCPATDYACENRDEIAVFSPPIPLPDVTYKPAVVLHSTAHLEATIDLAGGPPVTSCQFEWGTTTGYRNTPFYERKPIPCSAPLPYAGSTVVSADLSKLPVEQEVHYRVTVVTENGTKEGRNQNFRTAAVLALTTDPATDITKTTATIHGSLNPDNIATTYHFEFGSTIKYGQRTEEKAAAPGAVVEELPGEELGELQPGRVYHYRLVATNSLGTTYGNDRTLLVPSNPQIFGMTTANLTAA